MFKGELHCLQGCFKKLTGKEDSIPNESVLTCYPAGSKYVNSVSVYF